MATTVRRARQSFRLSRAQTITASAVAILIGIGLFALASLGQTTNPVLAGIASAVLSLGVVTFVSEFVLRSSYTYDLLELVQLEEHLHDVGIQEVVSEAEVDWQRAFGEASKIAVLLVQPQGWLTREWPYVVAAAQARAVTVDVFLPDPGGQAVDVVARLLGLDGSLYRQMILDTASTLEKTWRGARSAEPPLAATSTIAVEYVTGSPRLLISAGRHGGHNRTPTSRSPQFSARATGYTFFDSCTH